MTNGAFPADATSGPLQGSADLVLKRVFRSRPVQHRTNALDGGAEPPHLGLGAVSALLPGESLLGHLLSLVEETSGGCTLAFHLGAQAGVLLASFVAHDGTPRPFRTRSQLSVSHFASRMRRVLANRVTSGALVGVSRSLRSAASNFVRAATWAAIILCTTIGCRSLAEFFSYIVRPLWG